jgi:hypothetical protein
MKFIPPIIITSDPKEIRFAVVDYVLKPEAFADGTARYKRVPLPMGSLKIVFDTTFYSRIYVLDKIRGVLLSAIRLPINGTTVAWIEFKLREAISVANAAGDLSLCDESLGTVVTGEPEYFQ